MNKSQTLDEDGIPHEGTYGVAFATYDQSFSQRGRYLVSTPLKFLNFPHGLPRPQAMRAYQTIYYTCLIILVQRVIRCNIHPNITYIYTSCNPLFTIKCEYMTLHRILVTMVLLNSERISLLIFHPPPMNLYFLLASNLIREFLLILFIC